MGARYAGYRAVPGIAWLPSIWSPALLQMGYRLPKEQVDGYFFGYTYDDETMRQFAEEENLDLPGEVGDAGRFRQRYEWIMQNAREQWIDFRCRKFAELYGKLAGALQSADPRFTFYLLGQHPGGRNQSLPEPRLRGDRGAGRPPPARRMDESLRDASLVGRSPSSRMVELRRPDAERRGGSGRRPFGRLRPQA